MVMTYHTQKVGNVNLFYREAGDSKLPTMLLLHGFPSAGHEFDALIPQLEAHFHLFAPDTLTHREGWGSIGYTWSEASVPSLTLAYTTSAAGSARIRILDENSRALRTLEDSAEPGLNFMTYDLSVDRAMNSDHEAGEATGSFYLLPGSYQMEVRVGEATRTVSLVVKEGPAPRSRARKRMP